MVSISYGNNVDNVIVEKQNNVGVVLINWNSAEFSIPCIESLMSGAVKPDRIVVVDNASKDDSADLIETRFPVVSLIRNSRNSGFTGANNIGINNLLSVGFNYIWVLNNDTTVDKDCLSNLKNFMDCHKEVAACSGKILYSDTDRLIWYAGALYNKWKMRFSHKGEREIDSGQYDLPEDVPFISGCCMFVRSDAFKRLGSFDDHFFAYSEDADWCLRAKAYGMALHYVPLALIWHKVSASVKKVKKLQSKGVTSPFSIYITSRNRIFILRKHFNNNLIHTCVASIASGLWFFYYASVLLLLLRTEKFRALIMAVYDGITTSLDRVEDNQVLPRYLH